MAPEITTYCAETSEAANFAASAGLSRRARSLECPRQIRDDQEQRQSHQQYCKDDLLHYILVKRSLENRELVSWIRTFIMLGPTYA